MPSLSHDAIVELFRNRPVLAAELLREALGVPLPPFTEARLVPSELSDIVPRELRADLLVLLVSERPVLVVIIEVQLQWDPDKAFTWPSYVTGARARHRCPVCLLVVTPDAGLAERLAKPIVLGPKMGALSPLVLGPRGVPVVTDIPEAKERPELAVLSAMAHGRGECGVEVAMAALLASAGLDTERSTLYGDLVLISLSEAARAALEDRMSLPNYEYQSEFVRKNVQKGRQEGRIEGIQEGRLEGQLEPLMHMFERRLRRSLTADERALLATRIREQGVEHVSDLVLDLSTEALAAWLG